jgi:arylsulfatase A-like enzyme
MATRLRHYPITQCVAPEGQTPYHSGMRFSILGQGHGIARWLLCVCLTASAQAAADPAGAAKAGAPATAAPPNILLITLDTTRADRMGFLGSTRGLTPNLDTLARQSAVFTHAYSQVPITPGSHATIFTGTYPQFHHVNTFGAPLAEDLPYAPRILRSHGYQTAAFLGAIVFNPEPAFAPGFDSGFDTYDAGFHNEGPGQDAFSTVQRRAGKVVEHALAWLSKHPKGPFFVWVHLYDAHDPYDPPEPYKSRYRKGLYDGCIAYEDAELGKLFRQLKERGLYDNTIIAVMADHGESLGAHGEDTHGILLYDETIHVPLAIKLPRAAAVPQRIAERVELVDVLPTLLQATSIAIPAEVQGQSMLGLMTAKTPGKEGQEGWHDRLAYAENDYPHLALGWSALRSLRSGKYYYIEAPRQELYDATTDPAQERNVAAESTAVSDTLRTQLQAFRQKTASQREAPKATLDPSAQQKLGALGYLVGSSSANGAASDQDGPDPKDHIELADKLRRAEMLHQFMHFDEASALLKEILAKDPNLPFYWLLGEWMVEQRQFQEAVPVLEKAVQRDPESPVVHLRLGEALVGTEDYAGAIPHLEITEEKFPQLSVVHILLEMAYSRTKRVPETIRECKAVLQFAPDHYPSHLILGRFLELTGDLNGAVTNLKMAAKLEPMAPDPHIWLASIYGKLGRTDDANRERAEAKRLGTAPTKQAMPAPNADPGLTGKQ